MSLFAPVYRFYFDRVTKRLARMGLTYHDAIAETGVYDKSLSRLPPNMQMERQRRIKRAMDMSSKHVELPANAQVRLFARIATTEGSGGSVFVEDV